MSLPLAALGLVNIFLAAVGAWILSRGLALLLVRFVERSLAAPVFLGSILV